MSQTFSSLISEIRDFALARDWTRFHSPKNLAMAIAGESGELVAEFQWLTVEESDRAKIAPEKLTAVAMEIADIQIYLLRLADVLQIDIPTAVREKMRINETRFPPKNL